MQLITLAITIASVHLASTTELVHEQNMFETVFWELKPFLFRDQHGNLTGIFKSIFDRGHAFCQNSSGNLGGLGLDIERRLPSRSEFSKIIQCIGNDTVDFNDGVFKGINRTQLILGPIVRPLDPLFYGKKGFQIFQIAYSHELAIIVPRYRITLISKIIHGITESRSILLISVFASFICCVAIWFFERTLNPDFPNSFARGCGSAFWWSMASMTTVGYGDLVPKSPIGRLFALCWIFFGVLLGCLMTTTMTDAVNSVDHISIENQRVAVLENSYESKIAGKDYKANVVPAKSYEEVIDMVRSGAVDAGVMVEMVASWMQEKMHHDNKVSDRPIVIVKTIYGPIHFMIMMSKKVDKEQKEFINCMSKYADEVYSYSRDIFNKYLFQQPIHIENNLWTLFHHDMRFRIIVIVVFLIMVVGLSYDFFNWLRSEKQEINMVETVKNYMGWFFGRQALLDEKKEFISKALLSAQASVASPITR
uniref:Potassium channel domain-containing protein n=2 Tax=Clytia hemisphaerica TaxID=252671 RepID=A0A7M5V7G4_9CNID